MNFQKRSAGLIICRPDSVRPLQGMSERIAKSRLALLLQIVKDFPQFIQPNLSDWEKVILLRRWTYRHVRRALTSSCLLDANASTGYYNKDAPELFYAFNHDQGGVWCGGTAHALMMLYRQFGFVCHSVDMGIPASTDFTGLTHVINLVEIHHRGKALMSIQDGYLNVTYVDNTSNEPLDYFDLLTKLARREHQTIAIKGQEYESKVDALSEPEAQLAPQILWAWNGEEPEFTLTPSGLKKQSLEFTWDLFSENYLDSRDFNQLLAEKNCPTEGIYLLLFPFAIYGKHPEADSLLKQAQSIVATSP